MTMLSRHMREPQQHRTQTTRQRGTVWKKVVSALNCCGQSRSNGYPYKPSANGCPCEPSANGCPDKSSANGCPYKPSASPSAVHHSPSTSRHTSQEHAGHETGRRGQKSSPSATQGCRSKCDDILSKSLNAIPKGQWQKTESPKGKGRHTAQKKSVNISPIQLDDLIVQCELTGLPESNKIKSQSRGLDLKDISTVIKYAKSISFSTLQSLSPDGKESLKGTFTKQKSFVKSLVKFPRHPPCNDRMTDVQVDGFVHQRCPQLPPSGSSLKLSTAGSRSTAPQNSRPDLNLEAGSLESNNNITDARKVTCVPAADLQKSLEQYQLANVTQISPAVKDPIAKPQSCARVGKVCVSSVQKAHIPVAKESLWPCVSSRQPTPTTAKQGRHGASVDGSTNNSRRELNLNRTAANPPRVLRLQLKEVHRLTSPKYALGANGLSHDTKVKPKKLLKTAVAKGIIARSPAEESVPKPAPQSVPKDGSTPNRFQIQTAKMDKCDTETSPVGQKQKEKIHGTKVVFNNTEGVTGPVVIKSTQPRERKVDARKAATASKRPKLQRLFPECKLMQRSELQHILHPVTGKPIALGKGMFGIVTLQKNTKTGEFCAVKTFQDHLVTEKIFRDAKLEVQMLTKLRGLPCVPQLFGIIPAEGNARLPSVVQEFIGDQNTYLSWTLEAALRQKILSDRAAFRIALNIAKALFDVHSRGVYHCDLKCDNVMLMPGFQLPHQGDPKVKIIDFGRAIKVSDPPKFEHLRQERQQEVLRRSTQIAPEVVTGRMPYSEYSEIYSLGMIFRKMSGDRLRYLEIVGKSCVEVNFLRRPTIEKIQRDLTSYIERCEGWGVWDLTPRP